MSSLPLSRLRDPDGAALLRAALFYGAGADRVPRLGRAYDALPLGRWTLACSDKYRRDLFVCLLEGRRHKYQIIKS
jgi:hypothetical protein